MDGAKRRNSLSRGDRLADRPAGEVVAAAERSTYERLASESVACLLAPNPSAAGALVDDWGLRDADELVRSQVDYLALGETVPLYDEFPALEMFAGSKGADVQLLRCEELQEECITAGGKTARTVDLSFDGHLVLWNEPEGRRVPSAGAQSSAWSRSGGV